ncbi:MAG: TIGR03016 family PEP-CTERM system-associated outer membrane protein [Gammaproteobacteria bacterium]|nr:TIGR03016 family PEP-CTERM system-associated outer membrane protein [Gammaproteobacteria bacterium]
MATDTVTATVMDMGTRIGRRDMTRKLAWLCIARSVPSTFCLSLAVSLLPATYSLAGDWQLTESTAFGLTHVDRSGNNPYSGMVLQATPTLNFVGESGRSFANVNYRPTFSVGGGTTDPKFLTHDLIARGQVEAIEDVFFLGANASARLYGNEGIAGSVDSININSDGGQSYSLGVTPEFRFHLNRYADLVSRNNFNKVWYDDDNSSSRSDSFQSVYHVGLRNGRHFGPLSWRADASYDITEYDTRTDDRREATVGVGYRVTSQLQMNGEVGYERNDLQTSRPETEGSIWTVGADWNPGPRTTVAVSAGERYFGSIYDFDFTHTSRRTQFRLGASRDVDNRRSSQLVDSFFFIDDGTGNPVLDPATGDPIVVAGQQVQQVDEDYVTERVRASLLVTGRRTTARVSASLETRDYEVSGDNEDTYYLSFGVNREMGNRISAGVNANYQFEDNNNFGDSDYYDVRLSLSRAIGRESSASVSISHHERDADNPTDSYREDRIGITFVTGFL